MKTEATANSGLQNLLLGIAISVLATGIVCFVTPHRIWNYAVGQTKKVTQADRQPTTYTEVAEQPQEQIPALFKALDVYKNKDYKVIYDGHEYNVSIAFAKAKQYINNHYKNEELEPWLKTHLYRSKSGGQIIYMKYPNGSLRPLRDVIVETLHTL